MDKPKKEQRKEKTKEALLFPPYRMTERKIGRATFHVYSWFNAAEKEKDIVSTVTRLIQNDSGNR